MWFSLFLDLFALGTLAAVTAVPFRDLGRYYFRFHATLALMMIVPSVLIGRPWEGFGEGPLVGKLAAGAALAFAVVVLLENAIVRAAGEDLRIDALLLPVSVGVPYAVLASFAAIRFDAFGSILLSVHLLTAAAVLGTTLVAMTTGHWYLSNQALSFDILVRLCRLMVAALAAKGVVSGIYLVSRWGEYRTLEGFNLMVMAVRVGAGIVMAMVLALMSLSCAKRKANQSATGILYVGVVFVLIGEAISLYFTLGKEWPV